jgi:hypothetical protein
MPRAPDAPCRGAGHRHHHAGRQDVPNAVRRTVRRLEPDSRPNSNVESHAWIQPTANLEANLPASAEPDADTSAHACTEPDSKP